MKNKHFTEKSFTFLTINFIVGLGFLTTITEIFNLGLWGYLVIGLSLLTVCGTALVFSRMGNAFKDHYGGSYSYVRHLDKTLFEEELPNFSKWERIKKESWFIIFVFMLVEISFYNLLFYHLYHLYF
ncbi:hypothetical protein NWE60_00365 [Mycoplasmopsis felis]|nr:hypothetical protein [Mycoplasmopsis felis]WAM01142.1 hypothetical protein NWE60_00365 [Mycoplasmopsis felis]